MVDEVLFLQGGQEPKSFLLVFYWTLLHDSRSESLPKRLRRSCKLKEKSASASNFEFCACMGRQARRHLPPATQLRMRMRRPLLPCKRACTLLPLPLNCVRALSPPKPRTAVGGSEIALLHLLFSCTSAHVHIVHVVRTCTTCTTCSDCT